MLLLYVFLWFFVVTIFPDFDPFILLFGVTFLITNTMCNVIPQYLKHEKDKLITVNKNVQSI